jgi:hypothetical protein
MMRQFQTVLLAPAVSALLAIAVVAACDSDSGSQTSAPSDTPTTVSTPTSAAAGSTQPSGTGSRTTPIPTDTDAVGGQEDQTPAGSTEDCRADPVCPSSEHRTSDPCGAAIIVDTGGYLEGRRDAEQGLAYQIDDAPSPEPADNDDDDATVGPETRYRAGYAQGWCDGGGTTTGAR